MCLSHLLEIKITQRGGSGIGGRAGVGSVSAQEL